MAWRHTSASSALESAFRHWQYEVTAQLGLHDLESVVGREAARLGWIAVRRGLGVSAENRPPGYRGELVCRHEQPAADTAPPPVSANGHVELNSVPVVRERQLGLQRADYRSVFDCRELPQLHGWLVSVPGAHFVRRVDSPPFAVNLGGHVVEHPVPLQEHGVLGWVQRVYLDHLQGHSPTVSGSLSCQQGINGHP